MFLLREVPDNSGFMVAAYAIVAVVLLGYSLMLMVRAQREVQRGTGNGER